MAKESEKRRRRKEENVNKMRKKAAVSFAGSLHESEKGIDVAASTD